MKKTKIFILSFLLVVLLCSCSYLTEGEVYEKKYEAAHSNTTIVPMVHTNGKTSYTTYIPITHYYPESWIVYIKAYDESENKWITEDYYVTEDIYNAINIGDWFIYDSELHQQEQPYTTERNEAAEQ